MRKLGLVIGGIGLISFVAACGPMDETDEDNDGDRYATRVSRTTPCQTTVMQGTCTDSLTASVPQRSYTISGRRAIRLIMQAKSRLNGPTLQIVTSARRSVPANVVSDVGVFNLSATLDSSKTYTLIASGRSLGEFYLDAKF